RSPFAPAKLAEAVADLVMQRKQVAHVVGGIAQLRWRQRPAQPVRAGLALRQHHAGDLFDQALIAHPGIEARQRGCGLGIAQGIGQGTALMREGDQVLAGAVHHLEDGRIAQQPRDRLVHSLRKRVDQQDPQGVADLQCDLYQGELRPVGAFADELGVQPDPGRAELKVRVQLGRVGDPDRVGRGGVADFGHVQARGCVVAGAGDNSLLSALPSGRALPGRVRGQEDDRRMPSPARPVPTGPRGRRLLPVLLLAAGLAGVAGCGQDANEPARPPADEVAANGQDAAALPPGAGEEPEPQAEWERPELEVEPGEVDDLRARAAEALEAGELLDPESGAIALYLALADQLPEDAGVAAGLERSVDALAGVVEAELAALDSDPSALQRAQEAGAALRELRPDHPGTAALLEAISQARRSHRESARGERALAAEGVALDGPIPAEAHFRRALELREGDARALQGLAAVESALIRRSEQAAEQDGYELAGRWLDRAAPVRPGAATVQDARLRLAGRRGARVRELRDRGLAALSREDGIADARRELEALLRIAPAGEPAGTELRERIELATHYGLFRPGQSFTEA